MKYVAFLRQSKPKKLKDNDGNWIFEEDPLSHEMQLREIKNYIEKTTKNYEIISFCETNVSRDDSFENWKELNKALDSLKKGDVFIIYKSDRIMADNDEVGRMLIRIGKKGCEIYSASEENFFDSKSVFKIYRMLAIEFNKIELDKIRERTKNALRAKKSRGERVGHIPYGYTVTRNKKITPCVSEQETLKLINYLYFDCRLTYREVCERLCDMGIVNRMGNQWSPSAVHRILKNKPLHDSFYQPQESLVLQ